MDSHILAIDHETSLSGEHVENHIFAAVDVQRRRHILRHALLNHGQSTGVIPSDVDGREAIEKPEFLLSAAGGHRLSPLLRPCRRVACVGAALLRLKQFRTADLCELIRSRLFDTGLIRRSQAAREIE
jgi:hypothetical protein